MNDCTSLQSWDKRKVKLYWKVVEDLEFDDKLEAEQWLFKYYCDKKRERLKRLKDWDLTD